jgi:choline dehydrogenase
MNTPRLAPDVLVVGGGSAGAVVAARLVEQGATVVLLEAGPDYGPREGKRWPTDLLDPLAMPESHDWGYHSADRHRRSLPFTRGRVIGGTSALNGCAAVWGSRHDYDGWAAGGNPGWGADELEPLFATAMAKLRTRVSGGDEITPYQAAFLSGAPAGGLKVSANLNDLDEDCAVAVAPMNIADGVRFNTAFAYLDPVRSSPSLQIVGEALVDRVLFAGGRARGVEALIGGERRRVEAASVFLTSGSYGSPAILLRSGVGPTAELAALGIASVHDLPGVGANLHDHPSVTVRYAGTRELEDRTRAFSARKPVPDEQVIAKTRTPDCTEAFDLHLYPLGGATLGVGGWSWRVGVACMTPHSRGRLSLTSTDPTSPPRIDHGYLSDPDGYDNAVLASGVELLRSIVAGSDAFAFLGDELEPGTDVTTRDALVRYVHEAFGHYYHPVGTCKMGTADDRDAVVDVGGRVHGIESLLVADCSIMPVIPRANTNVPAVVIGERIAASFAGGG